MLYDTIIYQTVSISNKNRIQIIDMECFSLNSEMIHIIIILNSYNNLLIVQTRKNRRLKKIDIFLTMHIVHTIHIINIYIHWLIVLKETLIFSKSILTFFWNYFFLYYNNNTI